MQAFVAQDFCTWICSELVKALRRLWQTILRTDFNIYGQIFGAVTPCSLVGGYHRSVGHTIAISLKTETLRFSEKNWYPLTRLHGVITRKTSLLCIFTTDETPALTIQPHIPLDKKYVTQILGISVCHKKQPHEYDLANTSSVVSFTAMTLQLFTWSLSKWLLSNETAIEKTLVSKCIQWLPGN
jgi:hypothetical protein